MTGVYNIIADVGGTHTRLAVFNDSELSPAFVERYRNENFDSFDTLLKSYLKTINQAAPHAVAVAVAGPVDVNRAELTNRNWTITAEALASVSGAQNVLLLNDLQAQGYAIGALPDTSYRPLVTGTEGIAPSGAKLVAGVGTGFNISMVLDGPHGKQALPAEAGHVSLPIPTETHLDLWKYLTAQLGFASVEDVCSGRGLEHIYAWLANTDIKERPKTSHDILEGRADKTDIIAAASVDHFVELLGSVVGNLALTFMPSGGIYLVGGMARAIGNAYQENHFGRAMRDKGRFSEFVSQYHVILVEDDFAALIGGQSALLQGRN